MKIVIDIPDGYKKLIDGYVYGDWSVLPHKLYESVIKSIAKGKEVPKGHGRLIDADRVIKYWKPDHDRQFVADYFIHTLETADTVIEAESEQGSTESYRKTGKWKTFEYDGSTFYECPKCEETGNVPTPFCPFCGEKMW